ncbi:deoxycytidine triphosphate deaminase [Nocardia puris]|uniref:dCTP deaminase n=1 Tax=Nocardia puris TaxID=208602 RepID=UPI001895AAC0|nr:deoxycytidine triphosphate deaminase [Nocardia puris]MBF6215945.1 deoxycytidine triphosphate deaminase [Nocardia puris]
MLTGPAIRAAVRRGDIVIAPFDPTGLCANSHAFHLGEELLRYRPPEGGILDPHTDIATLSCPIQETGYVLRPNTLYLAATQEIMGGTCHAATLHACRSVSALGLRIQLSAPLGHCGAVIPWTLELRAAMPVRVYPGMTIGKIAFWPMHGHARQYTGRYTGSGGVVRSLLAAGCSTPDRRQ